MAKLGLVCSPSVMTGDPVVHALAVWGNAAPLRNETARPTSVLPRGRAAPDSSDGLGILDWLCGYRHAYCSDDLNLEFKGKAN
jgi:hypothetical protein